MNVAAIVLAAGQSRRFGSENKLLADLGGQPVLAHTVACLADVPFAQRLAVTGASDTETTNALAQKLGLTVVSCPPEADGMGFSIAMAIRALDGETTAALILPGDMPLMTREIVQSLLDTFEAHGGKRIVFAAHPDGTQTHPVIWPRTSFAALGQLDGPSGGKSLLQAAAPPAVGVAIADADAFLDIDTPDDLNTVRAILRRVDAK